MCTIYVICTILGTITSVNCTVTSLCAFSGNHPIATIIVVSASRNFFISCVGTTFPVTSFVSFPTLFSTCGILSLVIYHIVTKLGACISYRICFIASIALSGLGAVLCASSVIVRNIICEAMTKLSTFISYCICFIAIIALSSLGAVLCASSVIVRNVICEAMSVCLNCFLSNKNFLTNVTVLTFSQTCFCTSRSNCLVNNLGMTCCSNVFINVGVTASTCMSGVTLLGTSRSSYNCGVAMYVFKCGNSACFFSIASFTFAVLGSLCLLGSGSICDPFAPLMSIGIYSNIFCTCMLAVVYASVCHNADCITSSILGYDALAPLMSIRIYSNIFCTCMLAVVYASVCHNADCITSSILGYNTHAPLMSIHINCDSFCVRVSAFTGECLNALFGTSRSLCYLFCIYVSMGSNVLNSYLISGYVVGDKVCAGFTDNHILSAVVIIPTVVDLVEYLELSACGKLKCNSPLCLILRLCHKMILVDLPIVDSSLDIHLMCSIVFICFCLSCIACASNPIGLRRIVLKVCRLLSASVVEYKGESLNRIKHDGVRPPSVLALGSGVAGPSCCYSCGCPHVGINLSPVRGVLEVNGYLVRNLSLFLAASAFSMIFNGSIRLFGNCPFAELMSLCLNGNGGFLHYVSLATRAVNYEIVASVLGTCGGIYVFLNCFAGLVTKLFAFNRSANRAGLGIFAISLYPSVIFAAKALFTSVAPVISVFILMAKLINRLCVCMGGIVSTSERLNAI